MSLDALAAAARRRDAAAETRDEHAAQVRRLALDLVAQGAEITATAKAAGVTRATLYHWMAQSVQKAKK